MINRQSAVLQWNYHLATCSVFKLRSQNGE